MVLKKTSQDPQEKSPNFSEENQRLKSQLETQTYLLNLRDDSYWKMMVLSQLEQINKNLENLSRVIKESVEGLSLEEESEEEGEEDENQN